MTPRYLSMASAEFEERIARLYAILESCTLCPRACRVNRLEDETGVCRAGRDPVVSSLGPHFGEEAELVGRGGSGTVFLTHCNLGCVYCQNDDISHLGRGETTSVENLAVGLLQLQQIGCHNINFVTPTHFTPQIVAAIHLAAQMGLRLPIVYNCGGYESVVTLQLLDGIVDIYMPDIKYGDNEAAALYSHAPDYFTRCKAAVKEMHRQVGDLRIENGLAVRGVLIRHLVLPNDLAGSRQVLGFVRREVSKESYVNIMGQYRPLFKASDYPELSRRPTAWEIEQARKIAQELGLHRGFAPVREAD
jgi:putative pyruvate formate lyase activating enzyme